MTRIILSGVNGRMGKAIEGLCEASNDFEICAGVDVSLGIAHRFPTVEKPFAIIENADAIIDFSHHSATETLLSYAIAKKLPIVISTTGHTEEEMAIIVEASKKIAVFKSANMSIGINLMIELAKKAAVTLRNFDIEIVEKHHNQKLDAPSGTALMIADSICERLENQLDYKYDRTKDHKKREKNEIGIHSVRGGNIVGDHDAIFAGPNEILTISHNALSREVFASGALRAAEFIKEKPAGMYSMADLVKEQ